MQLCTKCLLRSLQFRVSTSTCINRKNWCSSKSKNMVLFEILDYLRMHFTKLATVTFIKHKYHMFVVNGMVLILCDEHIQLLYCRYNDSRSRILQLFLQNRRTLITVGSTLFKSVILFDCLVVQIFSIDYKQYLFNVWQVCCKLSRFERCQCFARTCSMPNVSSSFYASSFPIVG